MGLEFSTNLLISGNSSFKIALAGTVSESVCSSETISFSFFEIVQGVLPNFTPINNFNYVNQLRVLTVSNENFEVDLVPSYDEYMLSKNQIKRIYFQDNFAQSEKDRVKSKWLEKMNQLKKHILFFDFLENHYVSNDEVSKQHLSVIRKSNFVKVANKAIVRSSHPPLETVLITCEDQKTEVKATSFKDRKSVV